MLCFTTMAFIFCHQIPKHSEMGQHVVRKPIGKMHFFLTTSIIQCRACGDELLHCSLQASTMQCSTAQVAGYIHELDQPTDKLHWSSSDLSGFCTRARSQANRQTSDVFLLTIFFDGCFVILHLPSWVGPHASFGSHNLMGKLEMKRKANAHKADLAPNSYGYKLKLCYQFNHSATLQCPELWLVNYSATLQCPEFWSVSHSATLQCPELGLTMLQIRIDSCLAQFLAHFWLRSFIAIHFWNRYSFSRT